MVWASVWRRGGEEVAVGSRKARQASKVMVVELLLGKADSHAFEYVEWLIGVNAVYGVVGIGGCEVHAEFSS